ncbi:MAG: hypothetical protein D6826_06420 [Alphaproteobacteria bacterium]|nr:MAG: hypothetical protein D6826_06420 [Alphaproteobacteria bacterium]
MRAPATKITKQQQITTEKSQSQGCKVKTDCRRQVNRCVAARTLTCRARAARDVRELIKVIADGASGKLIAAQILALEGADSIQTAALAIKQGMTYPDSPVAPGQAQGGGYLRQTGPRQRLERTLPILL